MCKCDEGEGGAWQAEALAKTQSAVHLRDSYCFYCLKDLGTSGLGRPAWLLLHRRDEGQAEKLGCLEFRDP